MRSRDGRRTRWLAVAAVLLGSLIVAACGGDDSGEENERSSDTVNVDDGGGGERTADEPVDCSGPDAEDLVREANTTLLTMLLSGSVTVDPVVVDCLGYYDVGGSVDILYGREGCEEAEQIPGSFASFSGCEYQCHVTYRDAYVVLEAADGRRAVETVDAAMEPPNAACEYTHGRCEWIMWGDNDGDPFDAGPAVECSSDSGGTKRLFPHNLWTNLE